MQVPGRDALQQPPAPGGGVHLHFASIGGVGLAGDETGRFGMVDVRAVKALPRPVTLDAIKADPVLAGMVLVNNSRLSVQPVTEAEWARVCALGGLG